MRYIILDIDSKFTSIDEMTDEIYDAFADGLIEVIDCEERMVLTQEGWKKPNECTE